MSSTPPAPRNLNLSAKRRALYQALAGEGGAPARPVPAVAAEGPAPLSFPQERLWFLDRFQPGVAVYNMPFSVQLPSPCRVAAVEQALTEIVRRHEVLRTSFPAVGGRPSQVVAPAEPIALPIVDLRGLPEASRPQALERLFAEDWHHVFDLARGPLFRARLVRVDDTAHVLLINMHHIVSDGWSLGVLMRELSALYEAFAAGRPSPLAELPLRYSDYAREQRHRLTETALADHLAYWRTQLAGAPAVLDLPFDRPRPAEQAFRGETQFFVVPPAVASALAGLARRQGATLFMVLVAAWKVLLYRYTGQPDIVVGTPIANRNRTELEQLIGFFVNTLVLRTTLSGQLTFLELVSRVREVTLGAYAHQDLPFEKLVEELQPERNLNHNPLFQVLFALQNTPSPGQGATAGAAAGGAGAPTVIASAAKFDVSMFLGETSNGLVGELEYNTDLFDTGTATRMIGHYLELLSAVVARPEQRLAELPLLTRAERRQILDDWSRGASVGDALPVCVHRLFEAQVDRSPAAIAVELGSEALTYGELDRRANRLAHELRTLGAGPDQPVAVRLRRSLDAVIAPLAVLKAGAAYVPLDPDYPAARLALMTEDAAARIVITEAWLADLDAAIDRDETRPDIAVELDDLAYIIYTSGSTGRPKGVAMPHRPLAGLIAWHLGDPELAQPMRTLQFASLAFDVSFQEMFATWCTGGTLVLVDEHTRRDPAQLLRYLGEARVERLFLPPVVLAQLAGAAAVAASVPPAIREIVTAGEQLLVTPAIQALVDRVEGLRVRNQYGPTETHVVTEHVLRGPSRSWPATPPIGHPIAGARVFLLDGQRQLVPAGVPGELFLGGPVVARGYLGRAALTAERFVPDPDSAAPGGRLYRTGDLARYLPDGSIQFLGRADHQVKIRGFRIECGEVEAVLAEHPAVRGVAVVAREEVPGDKQLVAYVVPQAGATLTDDDVRGFLRQQLPEHMVPSAIVALDALPLSPNGKLDRGALPSSGERRLRPSGSAVAPRTSLEATIATIWREVLRLNSVGVHDSFFDLGGHSLLATQIMSRIREALDVEVPLRRLFERPSTIADLAIAVVQARAQAIDHAVLAGLLDEVEAARA